MTAVRLRAGEMVSGMFDYEAPRRRPGLVLAPKPTVCEACRTDTESGPCPQDCPARANPDRHL